MMSRSGESRSNLCPSCSALLQIANSGQRTHKFVQFITFIKLKTPFIKKAHQASFIFSLALKSVECNAALHKYQVEANKSLKSNNLNCPFSAPCYWKRMERLSETH